VVDYKYKMFDIEFMTENCEGHDEIYDTVTGNNNLLAVHWEG